jgi:hypothetical protein
MGKQRLKKQYDYAGSLFDETPNDAPLTINLTKGYSNDDKRHVSTNKLSALQKEAILDFINTGFSSARSISEFLIETYFASTERYSTGKPYIYVDVCMFLDEQVSKGICILLLKNTEDRQYESISKY